MRELHHWDGRVLQRFQFFHALSKLEIQLAMPMVLRRFPKLALAGEPRTLDLMTFHGYQEIPVTIS